VKIMNDKTSSVRLVAIRVLESILLNKGSLSTQLARKQAEVKAEHIPQLKEICFGVSRQFPKLNSFALYMLEKPFQEKDLDIYAAILIALYQIDYMDTPEHAAVNEAVESAKLIGKPWAGKLVNAILRRYLREADDIKAVLNDMPSVAHSHPKWILKRFNKHWKNEFEQIVEANNARPPMCLRVNLSRVSRETQMDKLSAIGIENEKGQFSESAIYLKQATSVQSLPGFFDGDMSVQDEAAQLSASLLAVKEGEKVLDACAAPGGKTGHLLESADIELTAVELEPWRLAKIEENLERLSFNAALICADSGDLGSWWDKEPFDKVLLDVPCSATGVIRRNPDIKINRKPADIDELVEIQKQLINNIWLTLKPGGKLLYATCSVMPEENEKQMADFLNETPNAQEIMLDVAWGKKVSHGIQLLPTKNSHDGFYYCLIEKKAV
jgi:16S rRNA (cytosine967-C5)-methyltransferase